MTVVARYIKMVVVFVVAHVVFVADDDNSKSSVDEWEVQFIAMLLQLAGHCRWYCTAITTASVSATLLLLYTETRQHGI